MSKAVGTRLTSGVRKPVKPDKHPLRKFTLWVALPTVAVFGGVCGLIFFTMHMMSSEMNAIDADRGRNAIAAAIESIVVGLGERAADEANWTEAYLNTYVEPNPAWLDSTWGATARISDNYDTAILTDTEGRIVFGESSHGMVRGNLAEHFSGALQLLGELEQGVAATADGTSTRSLSHNNRGVAALAGAVIHGTSAQANIPREQRRILWLARQLDDKVLRDVAVRFQLPLARIASAPEAGASSMALTDATGATAAIISWQPRRPGDPAFSHAASIATVIMLIIGLLIIAVLTAFRASIMSRAAADERDWYNARYDAVTGLPNGFALEEGLRALFPRKRKELPVAVAQVGLDGFIEVLDSYGREAGDRLLEVLADLIEDTTGGEVLLARTGPAEFTLARAGEGADTLIRGLASRVLLLGAEAVTVDNLSLRIGLSIGVADAEVTRDTVGDVIRRGETALARARETGGNHIVEYDPEIEVERRRRLELQADIRRGLDEGEFDLEYQPIIDSRSQSIVGVEALMRWSRRAGGPIGPAEFIPVAERSGLIDDLGMFALRRAIEEIGPFPGIKVSVNVSAAQLRNSTLTKTINAVLDEWGMDPGRLQLEVTESFLIDQPDRAKRVLEELRALGALVALDDFGTGFSSIGYLKQFQFDRVKLDRSLVADIDNDVVQSALVESTMIYAFAMGLGVTAEGVERREEAAVLARYGCREFQGYFFARPMPLAQLAKLLEPAPVRKAS